MAIKGMDISYWQGNVDFARVAADGIKFAILREGYAQTVDAKFRQYVDGCRKNGIEIVELCFIYLAVCGSIFQNGMN